MDPAGNGRSPAELKAPRVEQEPEQLYIRWSWLAAGFVLALLAGIGVAEFLKLRGAWAHGMPWERALMDEVHEHALPPLVDAIFLVIPWLGTNYTLVPAVLVAAGWLVLRHGRRSLALHLLTLVAGCAGLNFALKFLYQRPRPDLWEKRGQFQFASFPSGHAITSVAVLLTIALLLDRFRGWRWPYVVAAVILAISLYSRMYLGVHWPTDVVAGYLMGTVWLAATLGGFTERRWEGARDK